MINRSGKLGSAGILFHLLTFGLVGALIVILFGTASFSLLGTSKEPPTEARVGKSAIEAKAMPQGVFPHIDDDAPSIPAEAKPASLVEAKTLLPLPAQNPQPSEPDPLGSKSDLEPASPDRKAAAAIHEMPSASPTRDQSTDEARQPELRESQSPPTKPLSSNNEVAATAEETPHASPTQNPPTVEGHPPELSVSQRPPAEPLLVAGRVNLTSAQIGSSMPAEPVPDQERKRIFRAFQIEHAQPPKVDQANIALRETAPAQLPQNNRRSYDHFLSFNAALRYRLRRECGPITDPELRRHCIASFSTHYR